MNNYETTYHLPLEKDRGPLVDTIRTTCVPGCHSISAALAFLDEALQSIPQAELPAMVGHLERLRAIGWGRLYTAPGNGQGEGELLTVPEVAKRLKVSEYRTYELIRQGFLKSVRMGRSVRVKSSDLAAYIAQQRG